jgi:hypothetical protein
MYQPLPTNSNTTTTTINNNNIIRSLFINIRMMFNNTGYSLINPGSRTSLKLNPTTFITIISFVSFILVIGLLSRPAFPNHGEESTLAKNLIEDETFTFEDDKKDIKYKLPECSELSRKKERPGLAKGVPVQYVHIPKAGGTTIQDCFERWGHGKGLHVYKHDGDHEGIWACPESLINRGILLGHRGFGFCQRMERVYGNDAFYVVAFREPVSRLRSLFDYFLDNNYPFFHKYHVLWRGKELDSIIKEYNQTFALGLPKDHPKMKGPLLLKGLSQQQTAFMCGWDCVAGEANNVSRAEALERALTNLQRADVVVIMEKLDDMIDQMRFHTSWVPTDVKKFPYDNTHKGKKSILSPEASAIVREWATNDVVLYNMAVDRHNELTNEARRCLGISSTSMSKNSNNDDEQQQEEMNDDK